MDPQRAAKIKESAEALAYHVYGCLMSTNHATAGLLGGIKTVEGRESFTIAKPAP